MLRILERAVGVRYLKRTLHLLDAEGRSIGPAGVPEELRFQTAGTG